MAYKHNREPVKNTCPTIDSAIGYIDQVKNATKDLYYWCEQAESDLEDLRSANDALRSWGSEEAERVDELENTVSELELEIENLKDEIKSLEKELNP
jgi:peptidoglycan hydrolase CwlO-like protein